MEDKKKETNLTPDELKKAENVQSELNDEQLDDVSGGHGLTGRRPLLDVNIGRGKLIM